MKIVRLKDIPSTDVSHNSAIQKRVMLCAGELGRITQFAQSVFPQGAVAGALILWFTETKGQSLDRDEIEEREILRRQQRTGFREESRGGFLDFDLNTSVDMSPAGDWQLGLFLEF